MEVTILTDGSRAAAAPAAGAGLEIQPEPEAPDSRVLLARILASLEDDKAEEVVQIELAGKTDVADYMVVASGRSNRQVSSISEKLAERLKAEFGLVCRMEGLPQADWVLIDCGDVIVHVFRPEVRAFYQLEKLWAGPPVAAPR
ncbi:MAG: ribosome silencing factor [Alphaproteobacteria bacterium]|nr:MAG: ribosome silencing factor [Alphaproteobacteria bacterium]